MSCIRKRQNPIGCEIRCGSPRQVFDQILLTSQVPPDKVTPLLLATGNRARTMLVATTLMMYKMPDASS